MIKREEKSFANTCGSIDGSQKAGKTILARGLEIGKPIHYLDFERQSDIAKLAAPELYLGKFADHLVILDEIQRLPHQLQFLSSTYSYPALDVFVVKKFIVGG